MEAREASRLLTARNCGASIAWHFSSKRHAMEPFWPFSAVFVPIAWHYLRKCHAIEDLPAKPPTIANFLPKGGIPTAVIVK